MTSIPWYESFYGSDHLHAFAPFLSHTRTFHEVDAIIKLLGIPSGSAILDLCCGHGRHTIELAQRGYHVVGQDLSEVFLQRAEADAVAQDVQVRWVHQDMRTIPFDREFDAVINISTAFGYFDSEAENLNVLQQVHHALKPHGSFLVDIIHRDGLMRNYLPFFVTHHEDGTLIIDERQFDLRTSRSNGCMTMLFPDGRRAEYHESVRVYTLTELTRLIEAAGFEIVNYYGGLNGSPLTPSSHRMVVLSRKTS